MIILNLRLMQSIFTLVLSWTASGLTANTSDLLDLAREKYRTEQFSSFFALARWVRLRNWESLPIEQQDHWLALELMALARHCRWQEVDQLSRAVETPLKRTKKALALISVKQGFKQFKSDPTQQNLPIWRHIEQRRSHWKSSNADFLKLENPVNLRVKVDSHCADS